VNSPSPLPCAVISSTTQGRPSPSEGRGDNGFPFSWE